MHTCDAADGGGDTQNIICHQQQRGTNHTTNTAIMIRCTLYTEN